MTQWSTIKKAVAEKILKLFPNENIVLNKNFNNGKPDICFKNHNFIIDVDEGYHENYDSGDEKERKYILKSIILKFFNTILMIVILNFLNL